MHRKILAICAALVAIGVLAIPAAASAAITLREAGATVPTGTKLLATGDEEAIFAGGEGFSEINVVCTKNQMTGTLVKNDKTTVEGTIETASFKGTQAEEKCSGGFLLGATKVDIPALEPKGAWCIKNISPEDRFELIGADCGTAKGVLTFGLTGTNFGAPQCWYERTTSVTGTFTTTTGANPTTLTVTGEPAFTLDPGKVNSSSCPANGKIKKMKFTLSTDNEAKTPLQLDDVE